jgi:type III secretion protein D
METTVATRDPLQALELRVFDGPQSGARAPLATGVGCVLASHPDGHAEGADVVLREGGAPARVRITADLRDALLEVLEGEVQLGDQVLSAGASSPWAMHMRLKIGSSIVAFGRAALPKWPLAIGSASAVEPHTETSVAAPVKPRRTSLARRAEFWLAMTGGGVLLACGAALWTAHLSAKPHEDIVMPPPPSLAVQLQKSEFSTLTARTLQDGRTELRGRLATLAERGRLDTWLAERQLNPAVEVQVDETLVRDVTETFRINGVSVRATVAGLGAVDAEAVERDNNKLARAEEVVRRDVRGLTKLTVRNNATPLPKPLPPVPDDPGKRIASLVPGEPAYLVTADGSRYFLGSMLPTGHKIARIAHQSVTLEREGEQTTLNF